MRTQCTSSYSTYIQLCKNIYVCAILHFSVNVCVTRQLLLSV